MVTPLRAVKDVKVEIHECRELALFLLGLVEGLQHVLLTHAAEHERGVSREGRDVRNDLGPEAARVAALVDGLPMVVAHRQGVLDELREGHVVSASGMNKKESYTGY